MGQHDTAQICENGHAITAVAGTRPEFRKEYCTSCGAPTIMACKHCNAPLRGRYHLDELSDEDREKLNASLDDLMQAGPKTDLATHRFKKIASKLRKDSYELPMNTPMAMCFRKSTCGTSGTGDRRRFAAGAAKRDAGRWASQGTPPHG